MNQADTAIREDGKIAPIVAAREILRPLPDGFLLVDEAPCANPFTQPMHRSTGGRQYFHNRGGGLGWGMPAAVGVFNAGKPHLVEIPVTGVVQNRPS